jgi:hypothetical protein
MQSTSSAPTHHHPRAAAATLLVLPVGCSVASGSSAAPAGGTRRAGPCASGAAVLARLGRPPQQHTNGTPRAWSLWSAAAACAVCITCWLGLRSPSTLMSMLPEHPELPLLTQLELGPSAPKNRSSRPTATNNNNRHPAGRQCSTAAWACKHFAARAGCRGCSFSWCCL